MKSIRTIRTVWWVVAVAMVLSGGAVRADEVVPQVDEDAEAQAAIEAGLVGEERDSAALEKQQAEKAPADADAATTDATEQQSAAASSPPTDVLPSNGASPSQPLTDVLNFQTDLFTGRFSYRVPIAVAPARQNSQPSVGLGYNSSGGNSWCGVGWGLDMGYIQRETRYGVPRKWSGTLPVNEYEDGNGFVFVMGGANARLLLVDAGNRIYRATEDNGSMLKFQFVKPHWLVTDKNGNQFWFGQQSNTRMQHPTWSVTGDEKKTFRWALDKVQDANGNLTALTYTTNSNQLYLASIAYNQHTAGSFTSNTVEFASRAGRADKTISFLSGYRVQQDLLLTGIVVKAAGTFVRQYALGYTNSPSSYRALLTQVTQTGSSSSSNLPPLKFTYQVKPFAFDNTVANPTNWPGVYSQGQGGEQWQCIRGVDGNADYYVDFMDLDADGFPDRVMRKLNSPYQEYFAVQRNTGTSFFPTNSFYQWMNLTNQSQTASHWNSVRAGDGSSETSVELMDINGDGLVDRIARKVSGSPFSYWGVQTNLGFSFSPWFQWGGVTNESAAQEWRSIRWASVVRVDLTDINGDGWLDRVARKLNSPYTNFWVQLNTSTNFLGLINWGPLSSQGDNSDNWNSISAVDGAGNTYLGLYDINGDGLPDRVMRKLTGTKDQFAIQFNNGAGFEAWEYWGGTLDLQGQIADGWGCPAATQNGDTFASLADINGDGLIDRVMRTASSPYNDHWVVQLNTGSGFAASSNWTGLYSQGETSAGWNSINATGSGATHVDLIDINGDGLPDRVMRKRNSPYNYFAVQLNKGPFPDLMSVIDNSLSGRVEVVYAPSTIYDNRDRPWPSGDPWQDAARSLLPFPVWTVSKVVVKDGFGSADTNSYSYAGGMFDFFWREFRGFNRVTAIDPRNTKSITYFHQCGGTNDVPGGEYQDAGAFAKKGIPYRSILIGSDGLTNSVTLNKVEERGLSATNAAHQAWMFPFISQTIAMEYEGQSTYKATAKQFAYDFTNLTLTNEINVGEISSVVVSSHTFSDSVADSVETRLVYAMLSNGAVKPTNTTIYASGNKLRETQFTYDNKGNLTQTRSWLNPGNTYIANSIGYDAYGNATSVTNPVGIVTRTIYDSTYQTFPVQTITDTFTNNAAFDIRTGQIITATDVVGIVSSNKFDVFYRPIESHVSTNTAAPYGFLWRTKVDYNLGGVSGGVSYNYVHQRVNDATDTNGHESYSYSDGLGRGVQTRVEAENGQYRVSDVFYDARGQVDFATLPYFSSNAGFTTGGDGQLGTLTDYDSIGRVIRTMSPVLTNGVTQGDSGSPIGTNTVAYYDAATGNQWATIATDAENKTRKSYHDGYGRVFQIIEPGSLNTYFRYDPVGNLTNVTDHAGNNTWMTYDTLGRKTGMTDPDMGAWSYYYDTAGRVTNQTDAANQKITFEYSDAIGRLTAKKIYNSGGTLQATITYAYDVGELPGFPVYKGQLFKVTDRQGWQKFGYDPRGRVLRSSRYLSVNSTAYNIETAYDDADRVITNTYPGNATRLKYTYDTVGNLQKVESTCGTGTAETFYQLGTLNALGQVLTYTNGNGVVTTYNYYSNSKRLSSFQSVKTSTTLQNLSYTYDKVSNVKSITDGVYGTGSTGGQLANIGYDDLHRLTNYTWNSTAYNFNYNAIGNTTQNSEMGAGSYTYPSAGSARPHAVTSANGNSYSYDACGNMTNRHGQVLLYDEENQLKQAGSVTFGYADGGERLWKNNGGTLTIWIGGIYEIKGAQTLCHVFAGGRRVATFEPISPLCSFFQYNKYMAPLYSFATTVTTWPLMEGRTPLTLTLIPLLGVLCVSVFSRRRRFFSHKLTRIFANIRVRSCHSWPHSVSDSLARREERHWEDYERVYRPFAGSPFFRFCASALNILLITALFVGTTTPAEAATCSPVFWYYHSDHLTGSNIMTDRTGAKVDHYEYYAFGKTKYDETTCSFNVSNRFTGQVLDEDTGLYYYGSRDYDQELGRFIQADSIVPSPGDPQTLNRYSYCLNNPLKYTDPSGHVVGIDDAIIIIAISAAVSSATSASVAAARGGNIGQAAALGAMNGALTAGFGIAGAALGGAISAKVTGGDVGMGALSGAIGASIGAAIGLSGIQLPNNLGGDLAGFGISAGSGAIAGGIGAELQGGSFGEGAADGALGGAIGYGIPYYLRWNSGQIPPGQGNLLRYTAQFIGKMMNIPNTAVGLIFGGTAKLIGGKSVQITFEHNAIQFAFNNPNRYGAAITFGNVILYGNTPSDQTSFWDSSGALSWRYLWQHETMHTYQGAQLGPMYIPSSALGMTVDFAVHGPSGAGWGVPDSNNTPGMGHGSWSWGERGPQSWPPTSWH